MFITNERNSIGLLILIYYNKKKINIINLYLKLGKFFYKVFLFFFLITLSFLNLNFYKSLVIFIIQDFFY